MSPGSATPVTTALQGAEFSKNADIMSRFPFDPYSPVNQRVIDGVISAIAFWLAYQSVFEAHVPPSAAIQMWGLLPAISLGRICVNQVLRSYRTIWRYVGLRDAMALACSYAIFSLALVTLRYAVPGSVLR